jgi:NodT family efflux transporter outer membrane factor (OMF) lipoprotein
MAAANAQIGVAIAGFYPTVTLAASGGVQSSSLARWLTWPSRFWSFGPTALETIFEGGQRRGLVDQTRAIYDAAVAGYRQTVLTGFQEVEDNLTALRILEQEAAAQNEAVEAAEQSLSIAVNQYRAGIVSYLSVVTAQTVALNNQVAAVNIMGRRMTAAVLLIKALGGGWSASDLPKGEDLGKKGDAASLTSGR